MEQMAIAVTLLGFNHLGRLVAPIFLLIDQFSIDLKFDSQQNAKSNSVNFSTFFISTTDFTCLLKG